MLRNLVYYLSFIVLIIIFGATGLSGLLDSRLVYITSGAVIILSFAAAGWLTWKTKKAKLPSLQPKETAEEKDA
ncbi:MAG: hypothetical protein IKD08_03125 [Alphaproteobacteria bacterium]|nr:hypothetical protein [Alphaproteobacteria bacterium]